jgi:hypothetical protein
VAEQHFDEAKYDDLPGQTGADYQGRLLIDNWPSVTMDFKVAVALHSPV